MYEASTSSGRGAEGERDLSNPIYGMPGEAAASSDAMMERVENYDTMYSRVSS